MVSVSSVFSLVATLTLPEPWPLDVRGCPREGIHPVCVPVSHLCDMPAKSTQEVIWLLSVSQPRSAVQENPDFLDSLPILSDKPMDSSTSVRGLHLP